jgi:aspartate racemase
MPLEKIIKTLPPERDLSRHPLFPVVFGLQGSTPGKWSLPALEASRAELDNGASKFDWTVLLTETEEGCSLRSEYSVDLFEPGTIGRLVQQFRCVLEGIVAAPQSRLSELSLLTGAEREQLLVKWNQTAAPYERERCIHEVFEAETAKHPDSIALVFESKQLTFGEVNRRANQLARRLMACGVEADVLVGISLERSFEMIIAMLAILKAGGGYVPLDRSWPRERLAFMLKDTGASVLVTDSRLDLQGLGWNPSRVICVDREAVTVAAEDGKNPHSNATSEHLAYAIYTSGSTGTPKAVAIPHRGVVRLVRNPNYVEISGEDIFLQAAPISFDASTFEIWGALLNGSKLVILPPYMLSLEALGRTIEEEKVTILWLTAGLFHQMVDYQLPQLRGLRYLLAGGEALSVAHVLKALSGLGGCRLINGYGPTENTTFTCCYALPTDWGSGQSVPIGRPISNTQVFVLDERMQPVPIGMPGELYTGGDGLARGYLNRPELTKEMFVPNPFGPKESRLYRTGDLARWLPNGNLEFLGRVDEQVKIRGYRVEPGEVEAVLTQYPGVHQAEVVARPDKAGGKHLVAYVVTQAAEDFRSNNLREFLAAKLPPHLVPSHFVRLERLPLTANGKVDRGSLPEPEPEKGNEVESSPPRTETEEALASIWKELLGCKFIGVHQNLFHLGCHSLLATQAVSRIARTMSVELPVRAIFEHPTIAGLAEAVTSGQTNSLLSNSTIGIKPVARIKAADLLARVNELTDDEVEEMLADPDFKSALCEQDS